MISIADFGLGISGDGSVLQSAIHNPQSEIPNKMASPLEIAAYVALFALTGFLFLFANLLIGWLVYIAIIIWRVVRCVKGMQAVGRREPIADPQTWMV